MLLLSAAHALAQTTYHVDVTNCPGPGSGTVGDPFCTIQAGIDAAVGGDTVLVAPGTYLEGIDFLGKAITVRGDQGAEVTTIQGDHSYLLVRFENGEGRDSVLDGLTLKQGNRAISMVGASPTIGNCRFVDNQANPGSGGAMAIEAGAFPEISNCVFEGNGVNEASEDGGAIHVDGADVSIDNCLFTENRALNGGALYLAGEAGNGVSVTDCAFVENNARFSGGALYTHLYSGRTFVNCSFRNNQSGSRGSAVFYRDGDHYFTNCLFVDNYGVGPAIRNFNGNARFVNCTIAGNIALDNRTAGVDTDNGDSFANCVLWGNVADGAVNQEAQLSGDGSPDVDYSLVQGWDGTLGGTGNSGSDPLLINLADGDAHLGAGSAAIDAGDNAAVPGGVTTDLDGGLRLVDDLTVADTGVGTPPIVDIGAYEVGDCNNNGVPDIEDLSTGASDDCNVNQIPDECETDCNGNTVPDDCDLTSGTSDDCNANDIPDDCETDCNVNTVPDDCDIVAGTSDDCNLDGIPDECQPDEDCNNNGETDICDIAAGVSQDCQDNFVPDECDIESGASPDDDGNGVPDECDCRPVLTPAPGDASPSGSFGIHNAYLSFIAGEVSKQQAVYVTFVSLPGYEYAEGRSMWVQEPFTVAEASGSSAPLPEPTFWAAELGCTPHFRDWSGFGTIDAYDAGIKAGGTYELRLVDEGCEAELADYSDPLTVEMSAVGDVVGNDCGVPPCSAPQGVVDFVDIGAEVDKFKNTPGAIRKARGDIINSNVSLAIPDHKVDFVDLAHCVDAFQGRAFLLPGPPETDPCE
jgi:hypothetical protein